MYSDNSIPPLKHARSIIFQIMMALYAGYKVYIGYILDI